MQYMKTMLMAASLAGLSHAPAYAADDEGNFAVRGIGAQNCGAVVDAINSADAAARGSLVRALSTWLGGYLTYANRVIEGRFDAVPFVADVDVLAVVVDRCEDVPDATFETAASDILSALAPAGTKSIASVADLESSVALREPTVVALQQALIDQGYLDGNADGKVGSRTREAVESFNSDNAIDGGSAITIETVLRAFDEN